MLKVLAAFICIGVFVICGSWVWSVQKGSERYAATQQALLAEQNKPPPRRKRLHPAVPGKVTSSLHEYLYLDGDFSSESAHSVIRQFAIQSDGSLRWMSPPTVSAGDDSDRIAVDGQLRAVYVTGDTNVGSQLLRPYRIKSNGTLQPLPSLVLENIHWLQLDPYNHCLYVAIDGPPPHLPPPELFRTRPEQFWYRYRVHPGGKLAMPGVRVVPRRLPSANGFVYDMYTSSLEIRRLLPNGLLLHVARQQTLSYSTNVMPDELEVAPPGHYAYLDCWSGLEPIMACRVGKDGRLTLLSARATASISEPIVSADPSGRFLYVFSRDAGSMNAYRIEPNGLLSLVQSFWVGPTGDFSNMAIVKISRL